jgi:transcriptional regulator with XRE-family HTH domain
MIHIRMRVELVYRSIGALLRSRRRQLNWSQEKLAQQVHLSRATLANIETGRQRILVHQLYTFASALGVKLEELLPRTQKISPTADWSRLPIPDGLKLEQKEQIARLIESAEIPLTPEKTRDKK